MRTSPFRSFSHFSSIECTSSRQAGDAFCCTSTVLRGGEEVEADRVQQPVHVEVLLLGAQLHQHGRELYDGRQQRQILVRTVRRDRHADAVQIGPVPLARQPLVAVRRRQDGGQREQRLQHQLPHEQLLAVELRDQVAHDRVRVVLGDRVLRRPAHDHVQRLQREHLQLVRFQLARTVLDEVQVGEEAARLLHRPVVDHERRQLAHHPVQMLDRGVPERLGVVLHQPLVLLGRRVLVRLLALRQRHDQVELVLDQMLVARVAQTDAEHLHQHAPLLVERRHPELGRLSRPTGATASSSSSSAGASSTPAAARRLVQGQLVEHLRDDALHERVLVHVAYRFLHERKQQRKVALLVDAARQLGLQRAEQLAPQRHQMAVQAPRVAFQKRQQMLYPPLLAKVPEQRERPHKHCDRAERRRRPRLCLIAQLHTPSTVRLVERVVAVPVGSGGGGGGGGVQPQLRVLRVQVRQTLADRAADVGVLVAHVRLQQLRPQHPVDRADRRRQDVHRVVAGALKLLVLLRAAVVEVELGRPAAAPDQEGDKLPVAHKVLLHEGDHRAQQHDPHLDRFLRREQPPQDGGYLRQLVAHDRLGRVGQSGLTHTRSNRQPTSVSAIGASSFESSCSTVLMIDARYCVTALRSRLFRYRASTLGTVFARLSLTRSTGSSGYMYANAFSTSPWSYTIDTSSWISYRTPVFIGVSSFGFWRWYSWYSENASQNRPIAYAYACRRKSCRTADSVGSISARIGLMYGTVSSRRPTATSISRHGFCTEAFCSVSFMISAMLYWMHLEAVFGSITSIRFVAIQSRTRSTVASRSAAVSLVTSWMISFRYASRASSSGIWKISHSMFDLILRSPYSRACSRSYSSEVEQRTTQTDANQRSGKNSELWYSTAQPPSCISGSRWSSSRSSSSTGHSNSSSYSSTNLCSVTISLTFCHRKPSLSASCRHSSDLPVPGVPHVEGGGVGGQIQPEHDHPYPERVDARDAVQRFRDLLEQQAARVGQGELQQRPDKVVHEPLDEERQPEEIAPLVQHRERFQHVAHDPRIVGVARQHVPVRVHDREERFRLQDRAQVRLARHHRVGHDEVLPAVMQQVVQQRVQLDEHVLVNESSTRLNLVSSAMAGSICCSTTCTMTGISDWLRGSGTSLRNMPSSVFADRSRYLPYRSSAVNSWCSVSITCCSWRMSSLDCSALTAWLQKSSRPSTSSTPVASIATIRLPLVPRKMASICSIGRAMACASRLRIVLLLCVSKSVRSRSSPTSTRTIWFWTSPGDWAHWSGWNSTSPRAIVPTYWFSIADGSPLVGLCRRDGSLLPHHFLLRLQQAAAHHPVRLAARGPVQMGQFREAPALAQLLQHERARARSQQRLGQEQVEQLEGAPHHLHPSAGVGGRKLVVDQIAGQLGHDRVQHLARYDRRDPAFGLAQAGHVHIRRRPELDGLPPSPAWPPFDSSTDCISSSSWFGASNCASYREVPQEQRRVQETQQLLGQQWVELNPRLAQHVLPQADPVGQIQRQLRLGAIDCEAEQHHQHLVPARQQQIAVRPAPLHVLPQQITHAQLVEIVRRILRHVHQNAKYRFGQLATRLHPHALVPVEQLGEGAHAAGRSVGHFLVAGARQHRYVANQRRVQLVQPHPGEVLVHQLHQLDAVAVLAVRRQRIERRAGRAARRHHREQPAAPVHLVHDAGRVPLHSLRKVFRRAREPAHVVADRAAQRQPELELVAQQLHRHLHERAVAVRRVAAAGLLDDLHQHVRHLVPLQRRHVRRVAAHHAQQPVQHLLPLRLVQLLPRRGNPDHLLDRAGRKVPQVLVVAERVQMLETVAPVEGRPPVLPQLLLDPLLLLVAHLPLVEAIQQRLHLDQHRRRRLLLLRETKTRQT
uniref:Uncharacterized protein n=1 Tax=Anopheles merus TaxID=30066 RepID=A0A182VN71_ANOME